MCGQALAKGIGYTAKTAESGYIKRVDKTNIGGIAIAVGAAAAYVPGPKPTTPKPEGNTHEDKGRAQFIAATDAMAADTKRSAAAGVNTYSDINPRTRRMSAPGRVPWRLPYVCPTKLHHSPENL